MKNLKNEKGAITLVVLVTMLFLISFLMSAYMIVSNRAQKQQEISKEIQQIYSNDQDLNEIYNSYINNDIIPIYTVEQLLKIGSGEQLLINNKYCEMTWDATYALMNDLEFDVSSAEVSAILGGNDWTSMNNNTNFKGHFEGNGHTIKVTNKAGEVDIYSSLNNYVIIRIGDIIEYTPASEYTSTNPYTVPAEYVGCTGTFHTDMLDTVQWKVIGVEGNTINIIPNAVSIGKLTLSGANGWNNGIDALNNVCAAVYGNTESTKYTATARSLNVEDINEITGYIPTTSTKSFDASVYGDNNKFPIAYLKEKGIENPTEVTTGCGYATNSSITVESTYYSYTTESQKEFNAKFASWVNLGKEYWLSFRSILDYYSLFASQNFAGCIVQSVNSNGVLTGDNVFMSTGGSGTQDKFVRPVVSLTPKIAPTIEKIAEEGDSLINYWKFE